MNDRVRATAEDTAYDLSAVKADIARLSQQIADVVSTFGSLAKGQARRGLRQARANVDTLVSEASDRAEAVANAAQGAASSIEDTLSDAISRPAHRFSRIGGGARISDRRHLAAMSPPMLGLGHLWRIESRAAMRRVTLAAACALCGLIALTLLCIAGFVAALDRFGLINACLGMAVVFAAVALLWPPFRQRSQIVDGSDGARRPPPQRRWRRSRIHARF